MILNGFSLGGSTGAGGCEEPKKRVRVAQPVLAVLDGTPGKMILENHQRCSHIKIKGSGIP